MAELERTMRRIVKDAHDRADVLIDELLAENGDVGAQRRVAGRVAAAMVLLEVEAAPAAVQLGYQLGQISESFRIAAEQLARGWFLATAPRGSGR